MFGEVVFFILEGFKEANGNGGSVIGKLGAAAMRIFMAFLPDVNDDAVAALDIDPKFLNRRRHPNAVTFLKPLHRRRILHHHRHSQSQRRRRPHQEHHQPHRSSSKCFLRDPTVLPLRFFFLWKKAFFFLRTRRKRRTSFFSETNGGRTIVARVPPKLR